MTESLPDWVAVPAILILGITLIYKFYIKKGYEDDKNDS